jgi:hypothetical protein
MYFTQRNCTESAFRIASVDWCNESLTALHRSFPRDGGVKHQKENFVLLRDVSSTRNEASNLLPAILLIHEGKEFHCFISGHPRLRDDCVLKDTLGEPAVES